MSTQYSINASKWTNDELMKFLERQRNDGKYYTERMYLTLGQRADLKFMGYRVVNQTRDPKESRSTFIVSTTTIK